MIPPLLRDNPPFRSVWTGQTISLFGDQVSLLALPLIAVASIPLADAFDALTMAHLYAVAFVTGTLSVLFSVSYSGLFTALVPRERYVEANSLWQGSRALSFVAGPSLAGFLVQLLSGPVTLLVDAASFVGSALFVLYATRELHVRAGTVGLVLGAGAVGGVLGSAIGLRATLWAATLGAIAGGLFLLRSPIVRLCELPEAVE